MSAHYRARAAGRASASGASGTPAAGVQAPHRRRRHAHRSPAAAPEAPRAVPVIPVEVDGASYLVSPFGESDWVRNLRKADTGQLRGKARTEVVRATELPVAQRPPAIAAYRKGARSDVDRYFTRLPDPGDHPVFGSHRRAASHRHTRTADGSRRTARSLVLDLDGQPAQH